MLSLESAGCSPCLYLVSSGATLFEFFVHHAFQLVIQPCVDAFVGKPRGQVNPPVQFRRDADDKLSRKGLIGSLASLLAEQKIIVHRFFESLLKLLGGLSLKGYYVFYADDFAVEAIVFVLDTSGSFVPQQLALGNAQRVPVPGTLLLFAAALAASLARRTGSRV